MEQLEQLAGIRDAAEKRLEEARAAIERSPDAKLVASLTLLIDDLRKSFEAEGEAPSDTATDAPVEEAPAEEAAPQEAPAETGSAVEQEEEAAPAAEEFSLEDSLEAELLSVDDGSSKS